ncbi:AAA family ATPase, partial [Rhizobium ruizarguesonis]
QAWEAQGYRVHGAALAGKAAEGLEESSGIASRTLASWEYSWQADRIRLNARDVFVIDQDELGAGPFGLVDEAGEMTACDHATLVDDE